jgi:hypothetical protein
MAMQLSSASEVFKSKEMGAQLLDSGHSLLDSSAECREGLVRALPDGKELLIGNKASAGLLLDEERC